MFERILSTTIKSTDNTDLIAAPKQLITDIYKRPLVVEVILEQAQTPPGQRVQVCASPAQMVQTIAITIDNWQ